MTTFYCETKCCKFQIAPYLARNSDYTRGTHSNRRKAGVFVHDPKTKKILLVQSRGRMWGPPKGTAEHGETYEECGRRELLEETGLAVPDSVYERPVHLKPNIVYFEAQLSSAGSNVQVIDSNDANGVGWFDITCVQRAIRSGKIAVNHHFRLATSHFLKNL